MQSIVWHDIKPSIDLLLTVWPIHTQQIEREALVLSGVRQGRRSLASRGSTASLGSLADLVGWDEKSLEPPPSVSSAHSSSSSASTYTSCYTESESCYKESESEATTSRKRFPIDDVSSNVSNNRRRLWRLLVHRKLLYHP
mmetsp:Transcript_25754/g.47353  ORF Transcript_25754/g.47353 Transcript_25754/m.47353 type:complete len:141 (-) Transcript_25754:1072-1494(-)